MIQNVAVHWRGGIVVNNNHTRVLAKEKVSVILSVTAQASPPSSLTSVLHLTPTLQYEAPHHTVIDSGLCKFLPTWKVLVYQVV